MKNIFIVFFFCLSSCINSDVDSILLDPDALPDSFVEVLGVAQDAGYPQAGCQKNCCQKFYDGQLPRQLTSCISIIDSISKTYWIVDATPDFKEQLRQLQMNYPDHQLGGIFLTHAHVGHYTGLIHLGKEIMGAQKVPIYAMPRMAEFLTTNGPWSQLIALKNIDLITLSADSTILLNDRISIQPNLVPHRDEYSETVGYTIKGARSSLLFIPDIDKWNKWDRNIIDEIKNVDYALLDGSFYQNGEIPGRDMSLIPHPFIEESLRLFQNMDTSNKSKVYFIHFNHTNPVIDPDSDAYNNVVKSGMHLAIQNQKFEL